MNKYEIIGIVGEGAYGVVYKAKCKESGDFGKQMTSFKDWVVFIIFKKIGRKEMRMIFFIDLPFTHILFQFLLDRKFITLLY